MYVMREPDVKKNLFVARMGHKPSSKPKSINDLRLPGPPRSRLNPAELVWILSDADALRKSRVGTAQESGLNTVGSGSVSVPSILRVVNQ